jgi:hypothetical protein
MSEPGKIHARRLETSKELQALYKLLLDLKRHSAFEIHQATGALSPNTLISELRANIESEGMGVDQFYDGETPEGKRLSWYKITKTKKELPNVPEEIRKLYSDCQKAAASFSGIEASRGHVEKICIQMSDIVNRFPGLNN